MQRSNNLHLPNVPPAVNIQRTPGPTYAPISFQLQGPGIIQVVHHGGATRLEVLAAQLLASHNATAVIGDEQISRALDVAQKLIDGAEKRLRDANALANSPEAA